MFRASEILRVVLGINPNVIDEVLQNWQKILFLCLKYVSVLQLIFYFKGNFFFQLYTTLKSGNKHDISNYKPISIINCSPKLLDALICDSLSSKILVKLASQ